MMSIMRMRLRKNRTVLGRVVVRRDTAVAWAAANPVLGHLEPAYEEDTDRLKLGDGVTAYSDLPYYVRVPDGAKIGDGETPWADLPYSGRPPR